MATQRTYEDMLTERFFWCNPDKAKGCKKTTCFINGGNCFITSHMDWGDGIVTCDQLPRKAPKRRES